MEDYSGNYSGKNTRDGGYIFANENPVTNEAFKNLARDDPQTASEIYLELKSEKERGEE